MSNRPPETGYGGSLDFGSVRTGQGPLRSDVSDQAVIKRLMPDSLAGLTSILPLLDAGAALMLGDALLPSRIKADKPTIAPDSATTCSQTRQVLG
jgi:hypothetical protein